jgi:hypothetical protein
VSEHDDLTVAMYADVIQERLNLCKRLAVVQLGIIGPIKGLNPFDTELIDSVIAEVVDGFVNILELTDKERSKLLEEVEKDFRERHQKVTELTEQIIQQKLREKEEGDSPSK